MVASAKTPTQKLPALVKRYVLMMTLEFFAIEPALPRGLRNHTRHRGY